MMPVLEDESGLSNYEREEVQVNRARVTAERLRSAMQGLGTEEDEIFGALVGRTHEEIGEIKRQYFDLTNGHYLEQDLQDELSGEDLRRAINLIDVVGEFETTGFSDCDPGIRQRAPPCGWRQEVARILGPRWHVWGEPRSTDRPGGSLLHRNQA